MHYIGIDGSTSYSKLICVDENNKVVGRHTGSSIDLLKHDRQTVTDNLTRLIKEFSMLVSIKTNECKGVCIALTPEDSRLNPHIKPETQSFYQSVITNYGFECPVKVVTNLEAMLAAEIMESNGILVLASGDSKAIAMDDKRNLHVLGGWGNLLDGTGSAYAIGMEAIKYAIHSYEGRIDSKILEEKVCGHFNVKTVPEITEMFYSEKFNATSISELVVTVKYAAAEGDAYAKKIQQNAAENLFALAKALIEKCGLQSAKTVVCGTVFTLDETIKQAFTDLISAEYNEMQVVLSKEKAELGAVNIVK